MKIIVGRTTDVAPSLWQSYRAAFNGTFLSEFTESDFARKYASPPFGASLHALCTDDGGNVIGATSIVPLNYLVGEETVLGGVSCDSFVEKKHRKAAPFLFRTLLAKVESYARENGVNFVIAVPNENSFLYMVRLCDWKLIGEYEFYVVPAGAGRWLGENLFGRLASCMVSAMTRALFRVGKCDGAIARKPVRVRQDPEFVSYRLAQASYYRMTVRQVTFVYRLINEAGTKCAYLIDYQPRSASALHIAIEHVFTRHRKEIDLILFLGRERNTRLPIMRVPARFRPRNMRFIVRLLNEAHGSVLDINNWELGIILMDTR
jgi:hypothetical protein